MSNFVPDIPPYVGYSGQTPFRFWCQKVLPLVYDDSLSYYELLNKVVTYLNNTIQDVANVETNVDNVITAFNQLTEYVNTYFDNLDVGTEIDEKLDAMALDGTLTELMLPYLIRAQAPVFVSSIDDMTDPLKIYVYESDSHLYAYRNGSFSDTGVVYGVMSGTFKTENTAIRADNVAELANNDCDTLPVNTAIAVGNDVVGNDPAGLMHAPVTNLGGLFISFNRSSVPASGDVQFYISARTGSTNDMYRRIYWDGAWNEWEKLADFVDAVYPVISPTVITYAEGADFNSFPVNGFYTVGYFSSTNTKATLNAPPADMLGGVIINTQRGPTASGNYQLYLGRYGNVYYRMQWDGSYGDWFSIGRPGVSIGMYGDSIAYGTHNDHVSYIRNQPHIYNNAVSGATLATSSRTIIANEVVDTANNYDIVICNGGINDYTLNLPLGSAPTKAVYNVSDITAANNTVSYGLQKLFINIYSRFPDAFKFFVTTHKAMFETSSMPELSGKYFPTDANNAGYTQTDLTNLIIETCRVYGIEVIDVFNKSQINSGYDGYISPISSFSDPTVRDSYWIDNDRLHPMNKGYELGYIPLVEQAIQKCFSLNKWRE